MHASGGEDSRSRRRSAGAGATAPSTAPPVETTATDAKLLQVFAVLVFPKACPDHLGVGACASRLAELGLVCKAWRAAVGLCRPESLNVSFKAPTCRSFGAWLAKCGGCIQAATIKVIWRDGVSVPRADLTAFHAAFAPALRSVQDLTMRLILLRHDHMYFNPLAVPDAAKRFVRRAFVDAVRSSSSSLTALNLTHNGAALQDDALLAMLPHLGRLQRLELSHNNALTDACAPALAACTALTRLAISSLHITNEAFAQLSTLRHLRELAADGTRLDVGAFVVLKHMTALQSLDYTQPNFSMMAYDGMTVPSADATVREAASAALAGITTLETLRLDFFDPPPGLAASLGALSRLRFLRLDDTAIVDGQQDALSGLVSLTRLVLQNSDVGAAGLRALASLPQLGVIFLEAVQSELDGEAANALAQSTSLFSLSLIGCAISSGFTARLAPLSRLTSIEFDRMHVGCRGVGGLARLTSLQELYLSHCSLSDDGAASLLRLSALTNLTSLFLAEVDYESEDDDDDDDDDDDSSQRVGFAVAAAIGGISSLEALTIAGCSRFGPAGARALSVLPNLKDLTLARTHIGDAGVADVCRLLTQLTRLQLGSKNDVTDAAFRESLWRLQHLRYLDVTSFGNPFQQPLSALALELKSRLPNELKFSDSVD